MRIELEVRAFVIDDYGHSYLLQEIRPDEMDEYLKTRGDLRGFPVYYTVLESAKVVTFPGIVEPEDPFAGNASG